VRPLAAEPTEFAAALFLPLLASAEGARVEDVTWAGPRNRRKARAFSLCADRQAPLTAPKSGSTARPIRANPVEARDCRDVGGGLIGTSGEGEPVNARALHIGAAHTPCVIGAPSSIAWLA
jgi:hypothetical protein